MTELAYPDLSGIITKKDVSKLPTGYGAEYVNWAVTLDLLHKHAPGWLPETVMTSDGCLLHKAPVGAYLLIRFVHLDGRTTPPVPQSVMDNKNNSIPYDRISARDITDTQRRGVCMAAAFTFGLAYELWAKVPVESGYGSHYETEAKPEQSKPPAKAQTSAPKTSAPPAASKPVTPPPAAPAPMSAPPAITAPPAAKAEFVPPYETWQEMADSTSNSLAILQWSNEQAAKFLFDNYGTKSRQKLTKEQFEDFDLQLTLLATEHTQKILAPMM